MLEGFKVRGEMIPVRILKDHFVCCLEKSLLGGRDGSRGT